MWRASKLKKLNLGVFIEDNTSSDLVDEWFNESVVEVDKTKKECDLYTPEKFTRKGEKLVENYLSANFNLRGALLIYVINRDEVPETENFTDGI